uniref:Epidermal growth factor n=1 Tax=Oryzias latipes TaxID=8090 RepID=A0A3P9I8T1_ORYLA
MVEPISNLVYLMLLTNSSSRFAYRDPSSTSADLASQPFLMFCHGKSIHRIGLDGRNQKRLVSPVGSSVLLDFHFKGESVYWADRRTGLLRLGFLNLSGKLYSFDKHISGLAVDWIGNFVYWTSEEQGEVRRMDTNGKNERTLLRNLTKPSSISVDPTSRFLFWLSFGMVSSVQRSDEGGRIIMTLLTSAEQLKALTIDHQHRRLFWAQFGLQGGSAIASCDYSGKVLHIMDLPLQSHVVKRLNKYTGGEPLDINIKPMTKAPIALKVVHPLNQPTTLPSGELYGFSFHLFQLPHIGLLSADVNECAHWNHGCSLGCENIPGSYFCTCPEGYGLLPDRKTCKEIIPCGGKVTNCGRGCLPTEAGLVCVCPRGSALLEDGQTCSGCRTTNGTLPLRTLPPVCLHVAEKSDANEGGETMKSCFPPGPPPSLLVANLVDVRVISADGSEDQTLVRDPRGAILAVDYDPIQNQVYFASIGQKTIERIHLKGGSRDLLVSDDLLSPEGLAVDWVHRRMYWTDSSKSTIDGSTLAGQNRKTVVREELERPKGIAVHPLKKKLIWTDVGRRPVVEASSLEGGDRAVIASSGLVAPTGLTIDFTEDRLFWCDQKRGVIESAGLDGSDRRVVSENQVGQPFNLAVFEDQLWVSDWERKQIRTVHKRNGKNLQWTHSSFLLPASVIVLHGLTKPGADTCLHLNGGCTQVCEIEEGLARCSCLPSYVLSTDGKTCSPVHGSDAGDENSSSLREILFNPSAILDDPPPYIDLTILVLITSLLTSQLPCTVSRIISVCSSSPELESPSSWMTTTSPVEDRNQHHNRSSAQRCPSSHEAYCLYQGVCFYYPEMEAYACNCVSGYMGERCQFSDLEWLELRRAEKEKRKKVTIAACVVVLLSLLSLIACVTYSITHKNRSFLSYRMELLRYDPTETLHAHQSLCLKLPSALH